MSAKWQGASNLASIGPMCISGKHCHTRAVMMLRLDGKGDELCEVNLYFSQRLHQILGKVVYGSYRKHLKKLKYCST